MSNDAATIFAYLNAESFDGLVEALCKPPPVGSCEETTEALALHFGRSNARLLAFLIACSLLDQSGKQKLVDRLADLVLATRTRRVPQERHVHAAERELLDLSEPLLEDAASS